MFLEKANITCVSARRLETTGRRLSSYSNNYVFWSDGTDCFTPILNQRMSCDVPSVAGHRTVLCPCYGLYATGPASPPPPTLPPSPSPPLSPCAFAQCMGFATSADAEAHCAASADPAQCVVDTVDRSADSTSGRRRRLSEVTYSLLPYTDGHASCEAAGLVGVAQADCQAAVTALGAGHYQGSHYDAWPPYGCAQRSHNAYFYASGTGSCADYSDISCICQAPPSPSAPPPSAPPPVGCSGSTFAVMVTIVDSNFLYTLDGSTTSVKHVTAGAVTFTGIPSGHPLKLAHATNACAPTLTSLSLIHI